MCSPTHLTTTPPSQFYDQVRGTILGISDPQFASRTVPGQLTHAAYVLTEPMKAFALEAGSIIVVNTWADKADAETAMRSIILPAFKRHGNRTPQTIKGLRLIGCVANPDPAGFSRDTAAASIQVWPDLGVNSLALYNEISELIQPEDAPLITGSGIHCAFLMRNQVVVFETWRTQADLLSATHNRVMPAVAAVFEENKIKGDPEIVPCKPLGIAASGEVRFTAGS